MAPPAVPASRDTFAAALARFVAPERPLALARFHDGEYHVLRGLPYNARSGWHLRDPSWIRERLRAALQADLPDLWIGISPPCDFPRGTAYYRSLVKTKLRTFATVFHHRNFPPAEAAFRAGPFANACIVACKKGDYDVPANGVATKWDLDGLVTSLLAEKRPILLAAGPCAGVIVHEYWTRCPEGDRQTILDVGAAIDRRIHGRGTRSFHDAGCPLRLHACAWDQAVPWTKRETNTSKQQAAARRNRAYAQHEARQRRR